MAVCQFFLRGQCKFGDSCRNEHPKEGQRQSGFGNQSWTPNTTDTQEKIALPFTTDTMTKDLTSQVDRPLWPLSSYGPAKYEPNIISGLDESPEELRVRAVAALSSGAMNEYIAYASGKVAAAEQVYDNARVNVNQAYSQAAKQSIITTSAPPTSSAFGVSAPMASLANPSAPSAFGSSAFTNTASAFGKPSFGQPAFGQTAFGQTTTPAASAFGQLAPASSTSAFGQISQTSGSAFGQTSQPQSSLIKPATGAFGSLSTTPASSAFGGGGGGFSAFAGQPTAFGLGAAAAPTPQNGGSVFGQSSFGNTSTQAAAPVSVFSSTSSSAPSAFGVPAQQPSAFGVSVFSNPMQASTPSGSAFGPASGGAFSNNNQSTASPFAQPISAFTTSSPQPPSVFGPSASQPSPFSNPVAQTTSAFPISAPLQPRSAFAPQPQSSFPPSSPMTSAPQPPKPASGPPDFKNAKSTYKPGLNAYDSRLPPNYIELLPEDALEAFRSAKFEWGKVPVSVPPMELR